ncbi:AAA family ATPase [Kurthia sp. YJT4]|uniref:AAA family ATPase n=1 Tax=Kurthia sp. YJT4 TaxID=3049086 RepID=UPI00254BADDF|nr:AAA family ATPase [Kurthia sp. YJT4]WIL38182.1 AAA family ATPase [Kurthia sp. YJT4]
MYRSDIRESDIIRLLDKVRNGSYQNYLSQVNLKKVRKFNNDEIIKFDFPVTALVAPNGGGKTTILGSAALAYKNVKPSTFFSKSGKLDNSMANWTIEFSLIDKNINTTEPLRKVAAFKDLRWRRNKFPERTVLNFGVSRTVPAVERTELKRCATNQFIVNNENINDFQQTVLSNVEKILGKSVLGYKYIDIDNKGKVKLLTGIHNDQEFSEFHFGAGESSIIRLIMEVESSQDNALVLIEEIENGLHPIATAKLVEYLIDVAKRKNIQAIFTTHSDYALLPLPQEAVWSVHDGKIQQGKLTISDLRQMQYVEHTEIIIYTEDAFTKLWMELILRFLKFDLTCIELHYLGGDGNAVLANKHNNLNPAKKAPSICFIDGDSPQINNAEDFIFRLPGYYPEEHIYEFILDNINEVALKLCLALGWDPDNQDELITKVAKVKFETRDYHLLFSKLGQELNLTSEMTVKQAFINTWCNMNRSILDDLFEPINHLIPTLKVTN